MIACCLVLVAILAFAFMPISAAPDSSDLERLREEVESGNHESLSEYLCLLASSGDVDAIMAIPSSDRIDYAEWKSSLQKAISNCPEPDRGETLRRAWKARQDLDIRAVLDCASPGDDQVLRWIYYQTFEALAASYRTIKLTQILDSLNHERVILAGTLECDDAGWFLNVATRNKETYRFELVIHRGLKHLGLVPPVGSKVLIWGILEIEPHLLSQATYFVFVECMEVDSL